MSPGRSAPPKLFSVGHSNRPIEDFLFLLKAHGIKLLADIRRYPGSRKFPHFNQGNLGRHLAAESIQYVWFEKLGGFRNFTLNENSPNNGLESPAFRNYADYMMTDEFGLAAQELLSFCERGVTCMMCAEKFFWKCHRRLLSDYLTVQGVLVEHIIEANSLENHTLTPGIIISERGQVVYPAQKGFY